MKLTKTEHVPAHEKVVEDKTLCDLCGQPVTAHVERDDDDDVTIRRFYGYNAFGDDCRSSIEYDMCGNCFEAKLMPWMASQGATKPRVL